VQRRRAAFLTEAVAVLGLERRVRVLAERAEVVGRDPAWRGGARVVVARGFGPPAVTAECGAPLLATGGRLVVSEPPDADATRWPAPALEALGLAPERAVRIEGGAAYQVLRQASWCPERFPRRVGIPTKRPLW
jgi:16S rRNA (guanine527-N7)-methyltransferase